MEIDASIVLDELVHQFADPMAFFRELIQNAVDAGTGDVDVTVDFDPSEERAHGGRMTVEIRDFGVGMDRQIVQNELLKLFNSGKDRDLTKIGRFGIGFVSVFAVEPEAVCVDTGRAGESWRLLFDSDRTYELFERDVPFEGTSVRLFKDVLKSEYMHFETRAREVIYQWCKHVEVPIYFNGEPVGAPFDIDSPCKVETETEGTRIVAGYVDEADAPYGYYHSGLTLMEDVGGPWPYVSFKLDSRYLEHTLTRDQIIEDKNFHKALELLEEVVREELPAKLVDSLEQAVRAGDLEVAEHLAMLFVRQPRETSFWGESSRLSRRERGERELFPVLSGEPATADRLEQADILYWSRGRSAVTDQLGDRALIIHSPTGSLASLAAAALDETIRCADENFLIADAEKSATAEETALLDSAAALLQSEPARLHFGTFAGAEQASERPWLGLECLEGAHPVDHIPPTALETARNSRHVVLNRRHPLVRKLVSAAATRPDWAALMLLILTCPDATADDPGADELLRAAYTRASSGEST